MDRCAVLIPVFNEEMTINKVISDIREYLPDASVYVYDNNSTDCTVEEALAAGATVGYENTQGKGNVVRRMFREVEAEVYVLIDGDNTYDMSAVPGMVKAVTERNADMVIGDRLSSTYFTENRRPFHNAGNRLVRRLVNGLFGSDVRDIMTGLRVMSYEFVKTFPVLSRGFEIETEMTMHALDKNLRIESIAVGYRNREEGSLSKLSTVPDGVRVLKKIFLLYKNYRPIRFFGLVSAALLLTGTALFVPVLLEYLETGLVPRLPTLLVSGFCAVAAIQSFFGGLVIDAIEQHQRQDFEMEYIRAHENRIRLKSI